MSTLRIFTVSKQAADLVSKIRVPTSYNPSIRKAPVVDITPKDILATTDEVTVEHLENYVLPPGTKLLSGQISYKPVSVFIDVSETDLEPTIDLDLLLNRE